MSDIKRIDTDAYVTVQGQYGVVNEGSSYGIINIHTKQVIARNILSFLDCVKTLEYILGNAESQNSEPMRTSAFISEPDALRKSSQEAINTETQKLDELDLALARSLASYFEEMDGKIRKYYRDHHASREEADVIASYYLKIAGVLRDVKTPQDVENLIKSIETLKEKVSRYKHESYKYRWSTGLEKAVLVKLRKMI
ncbi:hypothetical protein [Nodularia spumigena]|jgi:HEAT repeat protein|uniref:Uncharacterized protein n=3 Tax=Nodularia spumigena TaxID=70799 RepID=A0A2S0Q8E5_NODSP|nr:hypothetical protein [Nodularia spumigena]AVZ30654.1 hypothetical protein BMF81_02486 [Nodularia spumigena UHCC 0039]MEA5525919.1 hypothetical protein [Nodularia spumigena UHCC 0143]MEA5558685.1 hypothetical protein [Nodularia spumigena CH309]MEA5607475.1 hypothetical protein [Nodularia spumigena UHCC 0060]MEA5614398.1 hypothetical protein [Nodularia spumigena UHCC 0040]